MVGELYPEGGARRDSGFYIFYMGINIGSFLGQAIVSFVAEKVNWHLGFGLAAVGMLIGLIQYRMRGASLGDIGTRPNVKEDSTSVDSGRSNKLIIVFLLFIVLYLTGLNYFGVIDLFTATGIAKGVGIIIVSITLIYFFYILLFGGLTKEEKKKVLVILFLFIGAALFWAGYEQHGSSFNLFARDFTDRMVLGFEFPAGSIQSLSPAFVILLAPLFGALWIRLAAKGMNPSTPVKFGLALIAMALGFVVMYFAALMVTQGQKPSIIWLVLTYFLHSSGEMALSPVGLSATTKLAPKRYVGQMMGVWFVGSSLGNLLAGLYAGGFDPSNAHEVPGLFLSVVKFGAAGGILFLVLSPVLKKWMGNVK